MNLETGAVDSKNYGDVRHRKDRKKRQKLLIVELFNDFANKTTLHGIRYIIDRSLSSVEKVFWLITFLISVSVCFYIITQVWHKWQQSPVIVTVSELLVPAGSVPFPSITICPQNKCYADLFNYSKYELNIEPRNNKYDDISLVCKVYDPINKKRLLKKHHWPPTNATTVENILYVAPTRLQVLEACSWRGRYEYCEDIFETVLTDKGVCFNMNGVAADELFRENSVQTEYSYTTRIHNTNNKTETYPKHGRGNGASPDLSVMLWEYLETTDKLCNGYNSGYKIYVQHPDDMPQSSIHYFASLHSSTSSLALSFNIMNTSESLRPYSPEVRQCYYPEERPLRYFKTYTASNCQLECLSNFTYEYCGCYWYSMPHNDSNKICSVKSAGCVKAVQNGLAEGILKEKDGSEACHCLPACVSVEYDADVLKTEFKMKTVFKTIDPELSSSTDAFSSINIYYKKPWYVTMRRSELFGRVDFLAYCGGLLGLFLGFSFLSLVEIIYFLTLRLCSTLKRDLQEEKRSKQEMLSSVHTKQT